MQFVARCPKSEAGLVEPSDPGRIEIRQIGSTRYVGSGWHVASQISCTPPLQSTELPLDSLTRWKHIVIDCLTRPESFPGRYAGRRGVIYEDYDSIFVVFKFSFDGTGSVNGLIHDPLRFPQNAEIRFVNNYDKIDLYQYHGFRPRDATNLGRRFRTLQVQTERPHPAVRNAGMRLLGGSMGQAAFSSLHRMTRR